jgi:hypothetical protein
LVSFHSYLNDFSLMILPLLIFGAWLAPPRLVSRKSVYSIVTVGFVFFLTPLYLVLLSTYSVGLFALVELAALWLVSRWGTRGQAATVAASGEESNSILLSVP